VFVVKRYGMSARRFHSRPYLLTDGIEIDERTVRGVERVAVLHKSNTCWKSMHFYRTGTRVDVMVFAKMRQILAGEKPIDIEWPACSR
jgi:hypothetical protein